MTGRLRGGATALFLLTLAGRALATEPGPAASPPAYFERLPASCPFARMVLGDAGGYPVDAAKDAHVKATKHGTDQKAQQASFSPPSSCTAHEYDGAALALASAIRDGTLNAPRATRLSFHASFTYSAAAGPQGLGGPNGAWIAFPHELHFGENKGLSEPLTAIKAIKQNHGCLTLADAITLAGAVAVEVAGGPPVAWMPGRRDALTHPAAAAAGGGSVPLSARLPDGAFNAAAIGYAFANAGLSARDAVALIGGGHSLGTMDVRASGWNGTFTPAGDAWAQPKNRFFVDLTALEWEPVAVKGSDRIQFVPAAGQANAAYVDPATGAAVARLPSDMALLDNPVFADLARLYARDEDVFLRDFARAFQRVLQLGAVAAAGQEQGAAWRLRPEEYVWLGVNGTATNYGVDIAPL